MMPMKTKPKIPAIIKKIPNIMAVIAENVVKLTTNTVPNARYKMAKAKGSHQLSDPAFLMRSARDMFIMPVNSVHTAIIIAMSAKRISAVATLNMSKSMPAITKITANAIVAVPRFVLDIKTDTNIKIP